MHALARRNRQQRGKASGMFLEQFDAEQFLAAY